jgi:hypothetical protein
MVPIGDDGRDGAGVILVISMDTVGSPAAAAISGSSTEVLAK